MTGWPEDARAWLALHLLDGWLLGGVLTAWSALAFGAGRAAGRRSAFREVDEDRAAVLRACERASAERVVLPEQRAESD